MPASHAIDPQMLEQAVLAVLAKHPQFIKPDECSSDSTLDHETPQLESPEPEASKWNDFVSEESLDAINKTLAAFRRQ